MKVGVIAEEKNDIEVLYNLMCKLIDENRFSFRQFVGHGCGKLRSKCAAWAQNLRSKGCLAVIVIHDLDRENEKILRAKLERDVNVKENEATLVHRIS